MPPPPQAADELGLAMGSAVRAAQLPPIVEGNRAEDWEAGCFVGGEARGLCAALQTCAARYTAIAAYADVLLMPPALLC